MVVVKGNLGNLQSSIDFFLSITSKNSIPDSKEIKNRFFEMFKNEDTFRQENFLSFSEKVTNDYTIATDTEPILVGEEEAFSFGSFSFADSEEYPNDNEVYVDSNSVYFEEEKNNLDIEKNSKLSSYTNLETEKNNFEKEKDYFEDEFISFEEEKNNLETENNILDDDDFIDYSLEEDSDKQEGIVEDTEESNWGSFEEDDEEGIEENSWGNYEEEYYEDIQEESNWSEEEYYEDEPSWGNYVDNEEDVSENNVWGSELPDFDSSMVVEEPQEEVIPTKNKVVEVKQEAVNEVTEVPKDLRDFVKLYHNCEMSFALKYFSKKEIDKQLSLGRIFKRKNRLLI